MSTLHPTQSKMPLGALVLAVGLLHFPLLLSNSVLWDSTFIGNAIDEGNIVGLAKDCRDAGAPQVVGLYYILSLLPACVHFVKLIAFCCLVGTAICIFRLARRAPCWSEADAFFFAVLAVAYPFYSLWQELIVLSYALCLFLFCLAAELYCRRVDEPESSWSAKTVIALALFLVSFTLQSLLVLFYALLVYYYLLSKAGLSWSSSRRFLRRHAVALACPPMFFVVMRKAFPTAGRFQEYNQIKPSLVDLTKNVAKGLIENPKRIVLGQIRDFAQFVASEPLFFACCLGTALLLVAAIAWTSRRLPTQAISRRGFLALLCFAAVAFVAAIFPYSIVGKYPQINRYECRHALLTSIPIAIALVASLRFLCRRDGLYRAAVLGVIVACGTLQMRNYILWQDRFIKYESLVEQFRIRHEDLSTIVVVDDQAPIGMSESFRGYELNWLLKRALGNERHMGFDAKVFADSDTEAYAKALFQWNRRLYMFADVPFPAEETPQELIMRTDVTVNRAATDSPWDIYWKYLFSQFGSRADYLNTLLSTTAETKPVDIRVVPPDRPLGQR